MRYAPSYLLILVSFLASTLTSAELVFSTDFSGPSLSDPNNEYGGAVWTVTNAAEVDLYGGSVDGYSFTKNSIYSFDGGFNEEDMRRAGAAPQFNSVTIGEDIQTPPDNIAIFSFAFEVKTGSTLELDRVEFNLGTASTSGTPYTSQIDNGLGTYNVRVYNNALDSLTSFFGTNQTIPNDTGNSMPFLSASPDSPLVLGAGVYRLDIVQQDKPNSGNSDERTTLDNLAVYSIPEPGTFVLVSLFLVSALCMKRRSIA